MDPLPSYGQGGEFPGGRYRSLINGHNLSDVVITGVDISHYQFLCFLCTLILPYSYNLLSFIIEQVIMELLMARVLSGGNSTNFIS